MNYLEVISKLKEIKVKRGLTNEALAKSSGVSLGTVNKLFAGSIGSIKLDTLISLASALSVPLEEIILTSPRVTEPTAVCEARPDNFGYVSVAVSSPEIKVADVEFNANQIISTAVAASRRGIKLLTLPELGLTGYTCGDLFYQKTLLDSAERYTEYIAERTAGLGMVLIFGAPLKKDGKIYNTAVVCFDGKILGVIPKTFLPNYNEFYDKRQFAPAPEHNGRIYVCGNEYPFGKNYVFRNTAMPEMVIGVEICEDVWVAESPSTRLAVNGATVIANLSCSDEAVGKAEYRKELISGASSKLCCAYMYANAGEGESTTDLVFSGHSFVCDSGKALSEIKPFEDKLFAEAQIDFAFIDFERSKRMNYTFPSEGGIEEIAFNLPIAREPLTRQYRKYPFVPPENQRDERAESILQMQSHALKKRLRHIGAKNVVLGISGGLDSTLALLVSVRAFDLLGLDRKGIHAITMPCFGTTSRTYTNAVKLTEMLGCSLETIDIKTSVLGHFKDIGHDPSVTDVTFENSQARERTQVLMDLSNKYGGIVIGTGDLSEVALGWATYNGDHMSMYGVNASVPKTLIRCLIEYECGNVSRQVREVLEDVLDTPVSPELLPHDNDSITQKTEDVVGPYVLHDFFLFNFIRNGFRPAKIYHVAVKTFEGDFKKQTIYKWLNIFVRRFFNQQFKRSCMPDGVKVGSVSLSPRGDWRMPSDAVAKEWMKELEAIGRSIDE